MFWGYDALIFRKLLQHCSPSFIYKCKFGLPYDSLLKIVVLIWVWYGIYGRYIMNLQYTFHYLCTMVLWSSFTVSVSFPSYMCIADGTQKIPTRFVDCTSSRVHGMCNVKRISEFFGKVSMVSDVCCPETTKRQQKFIVRIEAMTFQWSFMMCTLMSQQPIGCFGGIAVDGYWKHTVEMTWYLPCNQERNTRSASRGGYSTSGISTCSLKRLDVTWCSYLLYLLWSMQRGHLWFWKKNHSLG